MPCSPLTNPACVGLEVAKGAGKAIAGSAMEDIAKAVQQANVWAITHIWPLWIKIPSPDLEGEEAVVTQLHKWLMPFTLTIAVLAILAAATKIVLTRKAAPLADVGTGILVMVATSAVGLALPNLLIQIGDIWSTELLEAATDGQLQERLAMALGLVGAAPFAVLTLGTVGLIISTIQAVLMLFRQAALIVLAGALPLAAAGTMTAFTRPWFRKLTGWMLALIFYKPVAALVYATAFTMMGKGKDPRSIITGFMMICLAIVALPTLMKLFSWTTGAIAESGGGGGFMSTAVGGAIAIGALRSSGGGHGAAEQARSTSSRLGSGNQAPSSPPTKPPAALGGSQTSGQAAPAATKTATASKGAAAAHPAAAAALITTQVLASGAKKTAGQVGGTIRPPRQE